MDQSEFPILSSYERCKLRLDRVLSALSAAQNERKIRTARLKELRKSLLYLLDLAWTDHIRNNHIYNGKIHQFPSYLQEFYNGLNVMSIKSVMAMTRKVECFKSVYVSTHKTRQSQENDNLVTELVLAVDDFVKEVIPLCVAVEDLKSVSVGGREPSKASTEINPNKVIKTCSCCLRQIAVGQDGNMVHHGYKRTGHGYQTESCAGIRFKPLEESTEGLEWLVDTLKSQLTGIEERLEKKDKIQSFSVFDKSGKLTAISRGDVGWDSKFRVYIENLRAEARYLARDIKNMDNVLIEWKARHQDKK